jgi:hypothetical protein
MNTNVMNQKISWIYFVVIFLSVTATLLFHEFGHYIVGVSLGYKMRMGLTTVGIIGENQSSLHRCLEILGGPLFTLSQTIIVALVLVNRKIFLLYPLIISGAMMRMLPYLNVFFNYDSIIKEDEGKLSVAVGLPPAVLPILILIILIGIVIYVQYRLKISFKKLIITIGGVIISSMILFGLISPLFK